MIQQNSYGIFISPLHGDWRAESLQKPLLFIVMVSSHYSFIYFLHTCTRTMVYFFLVWAYSKSAHYLHLCSPSWDLLIITMHWVTSNIGATAFYSHSLESSCAVCHMSINSVLLRKSVISRPHWHHESIVLTIWFTRALNWETSSAVSSSDVTGLCGRRCLHVNIDNRARMVAPPPVCNAYTLHG